MRIWIMAMLSGVALTCQGMTVEQRGMVEKSAERGSASAQVMLGIAYLHGDGGLTRDPKAALGWLEQAAVQGNAYAEEKLGDLYDQGLGVAENPRLAADWREKAANRGNVQAQLKLGRMYLEGRGVAHDAQKAGFWLDRAAAEGNAEAQYLLGGLYQEGRLGQADPAKAKVLMEKSARQGHDGAVRFMHMLENLGFGLEESLYQRPPDLHKLAADGDAEAQYQLGLRCETGALGEARSPEQALLWYRKAAESGHVLAMRGLAHIYTQGLGPIAPDAAAARMWSEKANAANVVSGALKGK